MGLGLPDGLLWVYGTVHCWFLSKVKPFQYLWLLYFHDYFYDMMVIYILCQILCCEQIPVIISVVIMSVKFLSMNFTLLTWV